MKLSIFTTVSDPIRRGDCWIPAIQCYSELADEVILVDGSQNETFLDLPSNVKRVPYMWQDEFEFSFIGEQFQRGYEACTGEWVIHADIDFLFHETDFNLIRRVLEENNDQPALSFYKYQFILPDRYNIKSRLVIAVNKAKYGDRIKFNSGGDLCQPSLDGVELKPDNVREAKIPFYNYEKLLKTHNQISDDVGRMARAWSRTFNNEKLGSDDESAFDEWAKMQAGRFKKPQKRIDLLKHPQYIIPYIVTLEPYQFGYNGLGLLENNDYIGGYSAESSIS